MHKRSPIKLWRKFKNRYQLIGTRCEDCEKLYYPGDRVCNSCNSTNMVDYKFKPEAKLITWSLVHAAPSGYESYVPYIVAIVELEGQERMTTQIVNADIKQLTQGMLLKPVIRKVFEDGKKGIIHYGIKFEPK